jgi:TP901 family phage tail tape measure protein
MDSLKLQVVLTAINKVTAPLQQIWNSSSKVSQGLRQAKEQLKALDAQRLQIEKFQRYKQAHSDAIQAVKQQQEALSGLNSKLEAAKAVQAEHIGKLQAARQAHALLQTAYANGGDKVEGFGFKMHHATQELQQAETAYRQMVSTSRNLQTQVTKQTKAIDGATLAQARQAESLSKVAATLKIAGIGTSGLKAKQAALQSQIEAVNAQIAAQGKHMQALHAIHAKFKATRELAGRMAGFGARSIATGTATGAVVMQPVKAFANYEASATNLRAALMLSSGQIAPEFAAINALAERLGNKLPGTTADFQNLMTMLVRQGIPAKSILGGVGESAAYLAVQLGMDMVAAGEFAAKMQDATRTTDKDMMALMDTIQRVYYLGVDPNNMLQGFSKIGPALDIIKMKGLEGAKAVAPILAQLDQAGMQGEAAGNALRKVFQMSMNTGKVGKGSKLAGFKIDFTDGKGEFGGLEKAYAQLEKLKGLSTAKRLEVIKKIFGDDAETIQTLNTMMEKGISGYKETQQKMEAQASLRLRINEQLGTLKNLWDAASGTFTNMLVKFGESISPELKATTQWIGDLSEAVGNWSKRHPELSAVLMKTGAVIAIVTIALGALSVGLAGVLVPFAAMRFALGFLGLNFGLFGKAIGLVKWALSGLWTAMMFVARAFLMNPIGLTITVIAGGALLIWKYWEPLNKLFSGLWSGISLTARLALAEIKGWLSGMAADISAQASSWWQAGGNLIDGLIGGIKARYEALKNSAIETAENLKNTFKETLGIHSPSRVFAELGGFTMAGFTQGLEEATPASIRALGDITRQLTAAGAGLVLSGSVLAGGAIDTRPPLAANRGSTSFSTSVPVNITINAAPGMDERTLARLVAAEIARIQHEQAARHRARLTD